MDLLISALAQTSNKPGPSGATLLIPAMMIGFIVFMFLSMRSQKKREQREKEEMHARMSKNDRVLTIGGVIGTIITVKDTEVVLKVDESTNTKMTFLKSAVQRILADEQDAGEKKR
jgi:preprotein translocase subunit YajC